MLANRIRFFGGKFLLACLAAACWLLAGGCSDPFEAILGPNDVLDYETAEEKAFLLEAKPFFDAIAASDFDQAYDLMSDWGKTDVHPCQFGDSTKHGKKLSDTPRIPALSKEQFVEMFRHLPTTFGAPSHIIEMYVYETDPGILSGKSKDKWDQFDMMFAIGAISKQVPAEARVASVRGMIGCAASESYIQLIREECDEDYTLERIIEEGLEPYFTLKVVLVKDADALRVGYFEIVPPSMLD